MTMGAYIRHLRENLGLSQEELGKSLTPQVNRAAVNKWETGQVENIKRVHIQQMAKLFGVSPSELMCFDNKFENVLEAEEDKILESVKKLFGKDAPELLKDYRQLNAIGQSKLLEELDDMLSLPKYTEKKAALKHA